MNPKEKDISSLWARLASEAGLDPNAYRLSREWLRQELRRAASIRLYENEAGHKVIFKAILRDMAEDAFRETVAFQSQASAAMRGIHRIPHVLASDAAERCLLMDHATGETIFDLIEAAGEPLRHLEVAGRWLADFHRTSLEDAEVFRPKPIENRFRRQVEEITSGDKDVVERDHFLRVASHLLSELPSFIRRKSHFARCHGDYNLRNVIQGPTDVWAIDLGRGARKPIGCDIAQALIHYTSTLANLDNLRPGEIVPRPAIRAFFRGYDVTKPNDPSVQVWLRAQFLRSWMHIPVRAMDRNWAQYQKSQRFLRIANNILAE